MVTDDEWKVHRAKVVHVVQLGAEEVLTMSKWTLTAFSHFCDRLKQDPVSTMQKTGLINYLFLLSFCVSFSSSPTIPNLCKLLPLFYIHYQLSSIQTFAVPGQPYSVGTYQSQRIPLAFFIAPIHTWLQIYSRFAAFLTPRHPISRGRLLHQSQPGSNLPSIFHTLLSFFTKLSGDCQHNQRYFCWLRWLVG